MNAVIDLFQARSFAWCVPPLFCDRMTNINSWEALASIINKTKGHEKDYRHLHQIPNGTSTHLISNVWILLTYRSEVPTSTHGSPLPEFAPKYACNFISCQCLVTYTTSADCRMMENTLKPPALYNVQLYRLTFFCIPKSALRLGLTLPKMIWIQLVRWCFELIDRLKWSAPGLRGLGQLSGT
jgi:hypothetical protein